MTNSAAASVRCESCGEEFKAGHICMPIAAAQLLDKEMYADAYAVCTRDRERLTEAVKELRRANARYREALEEIKRREARSEYSSIYAAPGEFARIASNALRL